MKSPVLLARELIVVDDASKVYAEGERIMWRDGMAALAHIIRYRLAD